MQTRIAEAFSVHELFAYQVRQAPQAIAVESGSECLTYQELDRRSNQLANYLQTLGVGPETLVGVSLGRSPDMVVALLGILKAGGAYVPLDPEYPESRLNLMLEDAQIQIVLTHSKYNTNFSTQRAAVICLDISRRAIASFPEKPPHQDVQPDTLAYIIYTSGSTGKPKGVMIEHRALSHFVRAIGQHYEITASDRVLQFASISFDVAVEEIFVTLVQGATLVLRSQDMLRSISSFLETCNAWNVTALNIPTAFWHKICAELPNVQIPDCTRLVVIGSERAIPRWLTTWKQYVQPNIRLVNAYGPTEATVTSTVCDLAGPRAVTITDSRVLPIGSPLDHVKAFVFNETLEPVNLGCTGELYLAGASLARGYLGRPQITASKFITKPYGVHGHIRLYKTGDLVRYRSDGHLEFLDRIDNQEKIRGFRVELGDIESTIGQHSDVQQAVVVAREDKPGNKQLIAYIVPDLDTSQTDNLHQVEAEQLHQWRTIHDNEQFNEVEAHWEPTFNISGWLDSYTGQQIPDAAMKEWLDQTIERVLALNPKNVLEIGCGTGLVLFQIAPHCQTYLGTDFSQTALRYVQSQLSDLSLSNVALEQRTAHDFQDMDVAVVDTVIINSVIQYFPSLSYLMQVLEQALDRVEPGGAIFIGDVRSYTLLPAFALSFELHRADDRVSIQELRKRVQKRLQQEEELTIDPDFFYAFQQAHPKIQHVQIELKKGTFENELTQFRYDVTLSISPQVSAPANDVWLDWQDHKYSIQALRQMLQESTPPMLGIRGIPHGKVNAYVSIAQRLFRPNCPKTVGELKQSMHHIMGNGIDLQDLQHLGQTLGYSLTVLQSRGDSHANSQDGLYDAVLHRLSADVSRRCFQSTYRPQSQSLDSYSNDPLRGKLIQNLVPQLRSYLKEKLPSYMVPAAIVLLDAFPLTPNGKIDRRALPAVGAERPPLEEAFVKARTPLEKELTSLWSSTLEILDVGVNDDFFDLGGDSLQTTQIIAHIEGTYQVAISLKDFFGCPTVAGLAALIQGNGLHSSLEHMSLAQLQSEVVLDNTIRPSTVVSVNPPQNIFLTGATGFLGSFLLHELLQNTQAHVYCLVRAKEESEALEKLCKSVELCGSTSPDCYSRIIPIMGDLAKPCLGLSYTKFQRLASTVDVVYHSGASVNLLYPYTALKAVNVIGTHEILKLASLCKTKPLHYISTLDVLESLSTTGISQLYEQDSIAKGSGISGGYAQSKWIAEQLITQAMNRGLPACIYRPGMVSGHSHSGYANVTDLGSRFIKTVIQLGTAPDIDLKIDMTPVDYVSRAVTYLSTQAESFGKTFHLVNSQALPIETLVKGLNDHGYPIKKISYREWQTALKQKSSALSPLASVLTEVVGNNQENHLELWLSGSDSFDCTNALRGLQESSIDCRPADSTLLTTYLSYFIKSGFIKRAPSYPISGSLLHEFST
ncbi:MAG: amino acid adenylation domain-containing protein [Cyanobacteria bacterium P01_E01_bin.6]